MPKRNMCNNSHFIKNITLKDSESLILNFYNRVGESEPPYRKVKDAERNINDLLSKGYTLSDIEYTVSWLFKNLPDTMHLSRVSHYIAQAMKEKRAGEAQLEANREAEAKVKRENGKFKAEQEERLRLDRIFDSLPDDSKKSIMDKVDKKLSARGVNDLAASNSIFMKVAIHEVLREEERA